MSELAEWDSFYVIVGSAAGALIGLQFVVITLIAQKPTSPALEGGAAFGTPTIVHLGTALLLSALLRAPWPTITFVAALWGLIGFSGMVYAMIVIRRMRVQSVYQTQFEDWVFHALLPTQHCCCRHSGRLPSREWRCLGSAARHCCCCSSAFTTLGTVSSIMSSSRTGIETSGAEQQFELIASSRSLLLKLTLQARSRSHRLRRL